MRAPAFWFALLVFLMASGTWLRTSAAEAASDERTVLVVAGAGGEEEFATEFNAWAENWKKASGQAKAKWLAVGLPSTSEPDSETPAPADASGVVPETDYSKLRQLIEAEPKTGSGELWLVLLGHGTFNGKEAKFNLRGPDVTAAELGEWLKPFQRTLAIINCASASAPFLNALTATNRVVVSATRSGYEQNYARFGRFLSEGIGDARADLDKDGQTSLLEAFIIASKTAAEFYKNEGRLATEHALLDDNGDGYGTPADWFRGVRAQKKPTQGKSVDGLRAHQLHLLRSEEEQKLTPAARARRDELELSILRLRDEKQSLAEDEYYQRLEVLLLEMAKVYGLEAVKGSATNGAAGK